MRTGIPFYVPSSVGFSLLVAACAWTFGLLGATSPAFARPLVRVATPPVQPDAGPIAGHIYVAGSQFASQTFVGGKAGVQRLVRYPLVNGKPASNPDLMYPTKTDGPMAIDTGGNVYSAADCMLVNVFAPNKNTVSRSLHVTLPCGDHIYTYGVIKGLAVDSNGYLFVSVHRDCVSCAPPVNSARPLTGNPLTDCKNNNYACTLVYAPGANGDATPLFAINAGNYSNGMALNAYGRLFLEPSTSDVDATSVQTWWNPESGPVLDKSLSGSSFVAPTGIAIDFSQTLYVNDATLSGSQQRSSSYVAEFHSYDSGSPPPLRTLKASPAQLFWFGIAVDRGWLYTGTGQKNLLGTTPTLETFGKGASGSVAPRYAQAISIPEDPVYVAVGP